MFNSTQKAPSTLVFPLSENLIFITTVHTWPKVSQLIYSSGECLQYLNASYHHRAFNNG